MAEKKTTTKKAAAPKATAEKKAPAVKKSCSAKKAAEIIVDAMNAGFKAGDVYQTLAKADKALTVAEIAKNAQITTEEAYMGIGWLFKEGKIAGKTNKVELA